MVDHDNLEESAAIGVTAVVLIIVTGITIYMLILHGKNYLYPAAQKFLFIIFIMPLLIGWVAWAELMDTNGSIGIDFLMNLFRAICLIAFFMYVERMLGMVHSHDKTDYSPSKRFDTLCTAEKPVKFLRCITINPIKEKARAEKYLMTIRVLLYQLCVVLVILGIAAVSILVANGDSNIQDGKYSNILNAFLVIRAISTIIAILALLHLGIYANKLPDLAHIEIFHKFIIIKLGLLFTEIQPSIIAGFANRDLIASTSKYSIDEISTYTNALLLCSEMVIVGFLLVLIFPVSDYLPYDGKDRSGLNYESLSGIRENMIVKISA